MKLGAHVSIAGGFYKAVERAKEIGAPAIQIFASSPQSFRTTDYTDEDFTRFNRSVEKEGIGPIFFHGVYLINLASDSPSLYELSIQSLIFYLELCEKMPVEGVIFHIGSHKGRGFETVRGRIIEASRKILAETKVERFIIETPGFKNQGPDKQNLDILRKLTRSTSLRVTKKEIESEVGAISSRFDPNFLFQLSRFRDEKIFHRLSIKTFKHDRHVL